MADPFIGEIRAFGFNFPPVDWAACNGADIPTGANPALYSIIGNYYGGNSQSFKLPNLLGRAPLGYGNGPGLTPTPIGTAAGTKDVTLTQAQMAAHSHVAQGASNPNAKTLGVASPKENLFGSYLVVPAGTPVMSYSSLSTPNMSLAPSVVSPAGQNAAHENRQPYLTLNFCICLAGEYPVRP